MRGGNEKGGDVLDDGPRHLARTLPNKADGKRTWQAVPATAGLGLENEADAHGTDSPYLRSDPGEGKGREGKWFWKGRPGTGSDGYRQRPQKRNALGERGDGVTERHGQHGIPSDGGLFTRHSAILRGDALGLFVYTTLSSSPTPFPPHV